MKGGKCANGNLVSIMFLGMVILLYAYGSGTIINFLDGAVENADGIAVVYFAGKLGTTIAKGVMVWLPVLYSMNIMVISIFARLIYKPQKSSVTAYRIIMTVVYIQILIPLICFLLVIFEIPIIKLLAISGIMISVLTINAINTYTKRIYE